MRALSLYKNYGLGLVSFFQLAINRTLICKNGMKLDRFFVFLGSDIKFTKKIKNFVCVNWKISIGTAHVTVYNYINSEDFKSLFKNRLSTYI